MDVGNLHPNGHCILQMAAAWNEADVAKIMSFFDDDPTYHLAGQNAVSGTYRGRDEIERLTHRLLDIGQRGVKVEPLDILANDQNVVFIYRTHSEGATRDLDVTVAHASEHGANGKVQRIWFLADDQSAWDEFFAGAE